MDTPLPLKEGTAADCQLEEAVRTLRLLALAINFEIAHTCHFEAFGTRTAKCFAQSTLRKVLCAKYFAQSTLRKALCGPRSESFEVACVCNFEVYSQSK